MRTRSGAARSASWILPTPTRCRPRSTGCSPITIRCGAALARPKSTPKVVLDELTSVADKMLALHGPRLEDARRQAPRRQAHPVRGRARHAARHRPRHLSVRHLVEHGRRTGGGGLGRRPGRHRLCARHHQGLYDARRRGAVPDRAAERDRRVPRHARPRVRHRDRAASAAAAGSTPCWCARRWQSTASRASR